MDVAFTHPLERDAMRGRDHLKDEIEVFHTIKGEYDHNTGEYGQDAEVVTWRGSGSIQPYIRTSLGGVVPPTGGLALAIDAFKIFLPYEALVRKGSGYRIRSGDRCFEPQHAPLNPGGQDDHWVIIAAEVNRL